MIRVCDIAASVVAPIFLKKDRLACKMGKQRSTAGISRQATKFRNQPAADRLVNARPTAPQRWKIALPRHSRPSVLHWLTDANGIATPFGSCEHGGFGTENDVHDACSYTTVGNANTGS